MVQNACPHYCLYTSCGTRTDTTYNPGEQTDLPKVVVMSQWHHIVYKTLRPWATRQNPWVQVCICNNNAFWVAAILLVGQLVVWTPSGHTRTEGSGVQWATNLLEAAILFPEKYSCSVTSILGNFTAMMISWLRNFYTGPLGLGHGIPWRMHTCMAAGPNDGAHMQKEKR